MAATLTYGPRLDEMVYAAMTPGQVYVAADVGALVSDIHLTVVGRMLNKLHKDGLVEKWPDTESGSAKRYLWRRV